MNKQDKLFLETMQDIETLEHICKDNPNTMKQIGFVKGDIMRLVNGKSGVKLKV